MKHHAPIDTKKVPNAENMMPSGNTDCVDPKRITEMPKRINGYEKKSFMMNILLHYWKRNRKTN